MLVSVDRERVGASGRVKSAIYFAEICWEVVLFKLNYAVDELVAVASTRYRRGDSRSNGHVEGNGQGGGLRRVASGYQRGGHRTHAGVAEARLIACGNRPANTR